MRRAPDFWWRSEPSWQSSLLAPPSWIYGAVTARRMARAGLTLPCPVICVGNLVAGGAGKTPTALAVAEMLLAQGRRPAFLSRGYGRASPPDESVLRVDPALHDAARVGDEPLLLAVLAPTYVARDRSAAGRLAVAEGADVLVLDDGLQNPALTKSLSIAVVDGRTGVGNGACIPAGPLRAPLPDQWPHVDAACIVGAGIAGLAVARAARAAAIPVWMARLAADETALSRLRGIRLLAFAGIGHPAKFFATLAEGGLDLAGTRAFPDHHRFTAADLAALQAEATSAGAHLVTTAKDRVRLPGGFPVSVLPVKLVFDDPAIIESSLGALLPTKA